MQGWLNGCNVRSEDRVSMEELRTRLKLKSMRECLQDRRLQWFDALERIEVSAWYNKCRIFKISSSFHREQPLKTWYEVIRSDLKGWKVCNDIDKDRLAGLSYKTAQLIKYEKQTFKRTR